MFFSTDPTNIKINIGLPACFLDYKFFILLLSSLIEERD